MLAVIDADPADFAAAIGRLLIDRRSSFPLPYDLRQAIVQCRAERVIRDRAPDAAASNAAAVRRAAARDILDAAGGQQADQPWWRDLARSQFMPPGIREGLFLRPTRDRTAVLLVATDRDVDRWFFAYRKSARAQIDDAIAVKFGGRIRPLTVASFAGLSAGLGDAAVGIGGEL